MALPQVPQKVSVNANTDFEAARALYSLRPYRSTIKPRGTKLSLLERRQQMRMRAPKSVTLASGRTIDVGGGGAGYYYPGLKSSDPKERAAALGKGRAAFFRNILPAVTADATRQERIKIQSIPGAAKNYQDAIKSFMADQVATERAKQETIPGYGKLVQEAKGLGTSSENTFIDPKTQRSQVNRAGVGGSAMIQRLSKTDPDRARKILGLKPDQSLPTFGLVKTNDMTDPYYVAQSVAQISGSKTSKADINSLPRSAVEYVTAEQDNAGSGKDIIKQYGGNILGPYPDVTRKRLIKDSIRNGWKNQDYAELTDERILELSLTSPAGTVEQELRDWARGVGNETRSYATLPVAAVMLANEARKGNFDPLKQMASQTASDYLKLMKAGATGDLPYIYQYAKKNPISTAMTVVEGLGVAGKTLSTVGKLKVTQKALSRTKLGQKVKGIPTTNQLSYTNPGFTKPTIVGPVRQNIFNQTLAAGKKALLEYTPPVVKEGETLSRTSSFLSKRAKNYRIKTQNRAATEATGRALHNAQVEARQVTAAFERSLLGLSDKTRKRLIFELAVAPEVIIDGKRVKTTPLMLARMYERSLPTVDADGNAVAGKAFDLEGKEITIIPGSENERHLKAAIAELQALEKVDATKVLRLLNEPRRGLIRVLEGQSVRSHALTIEQTNQRILHALGVTKDVTKQRLYDMTRWTVDNELRGGKVATDAETLIPPKIQTIKDELAYVESLKGPRSDDPLVPYGSGGRRKALEPAPGVSQILGERTVFEDIPDPGGTLPPGFSFIKPLFTINDSPLSDLKIPIGITTRAKFADTKVVSTLALYNLKTPAGIIAFEAPPYARIDIAKAIIDNFDLSKKTNTQMARMARMAIREGQYSKVFFSDKAARIAEYAKWATFQSDRKSGSSRTTFNSTADDIIDSSGAKRNFKQFTVKDFGLGDGVVVFADDAESAKLFAQSIAKEIQAADPSLVGYLLVDAVRKAATQSFADAYFASRLDQAPIRQWVDNFDARVSAANQADMGGTPEAPVIKPIPEPRGKLHDVVISAITTGVMSWDDSAKVKTNFLIGDVPDLTAAIAKMKGAATKNGEVWRLTEEQAFNIYKLVKADSASPNAGGLDDLTSGERSAMRRTVANLEKQFPDFAERRKTRPASALTPEPTPTPTPAAVPEPAQAPEPTPSPTPEPEPTPAVGPPTSGNGYQISDITPEEQADSDAYFFENMNNTKRVPREVANEDMPAIRDLDQNEVSFGSISSWLDSMRGFADKPMRDRIETINRQIKDILTSPQVTRVMSSTGAGAQVGRRGTVRINFEVFVGRGESGRTGFLTPRISAMALFDSFDGRSPRINYAFDGFDAKSIHASLLSDSYPGAKQLDDFVPALERMVRTLHNNIADTNLPIARGIANDAKQIGPLSNLSRYIGNQDGDITPSEGEAPGTNHPLMPHIKLVLDDAQQQIGSFDEVSYKLGSEPPIKPGVVEFSQTTPVTLDGATSASKRGPKPTLAPTPEVPVAPVAGAPTPEPPTAPTPTPAATPPVRTPVPGIYNGPAPKPSTPAPPYLPGDPNKLLVPIGTYIPRMPTPEAIEDIIRESTQLNRKGQKLVPRMNLQNDGSILGITYWRESFGDNGRLIALVAQTPIDTVKRADTMLHEILHGVPRELAAMAPSELKILEAWMGKSLSKWTSDNHEKFVDSMMLYLQSGKAPTPKLQKIYNAIRTYMLHQVMQLNRMRRGFQDTGLPDEVKGVFDRYFKYEGKAWDNGVVKPTSSPIRSALRDAAIRSGSTPEEIDTVLGLLDARARLWETLVPGRKKANDWWAAADGAGIRGAISVKYDAQLSVAGLNSWTKWLKNELKIQEELLQGRVGDAATKMIDETSKAVDAGDLVGPTIFVRTGRDSGGLGAAEALDVSTVKPGPMVPILGSQQRKRTGKSGALGIMNLNAKNLVQKAQVPKRMFTLVTALNKFIRANSDAITIRNEKDFERLLKQEVNLGEVQFVNAQTAFKVNNPDEATNLLIKLDNAVDNPKQDSARLLMTEVGNMDYVREAIGDTPEKRAAFFKQGKKLDLLVIPNTTWNKMSEVLNDAARSQDPNILTRFSQSWQRINLTLLPRTFSANVTGNAGLALLATFRPRALLLTLKLMKQNKLPADVQSRGIYGMLSEAQAFDGRLQGKLKPFALPVKGVKTWMSLLQRGNILSEDFARATLYVDGLMTNSNRAAGRRFLANMRKMDQEAQELFDAALKGTSNRPKIIAIQQASLQRAEDWLGSYRHGGAFERAAAVAVPFNQWYRHILRLTFITMPYDYPGRSAMLGTLAKMGEEYQKENGVWPEWMQDLLPFWEEERKTPYGKQRVIGGIRTSALNPFATASQVADFMPTGQGGGGALNSFVQLSSPILQTGIEIIGGMVFAPGGSKSVVDADTGDRVEVGINKPYANFVARELENLLPVAFLRQPDQTATSSFFNPQKKTYKVPRGLERSTIDNTLWIKLLRSVGVSPAVVDAQGPKAKAALDSYMQSLIRKRAQGN
jgi:hypothetical protein